MLTFTFWQLSIACILMRGRFKCCLYWDIMEITYPLWKSFECPKVKKWIWLVVIDYKNETSIRPHVKYGRQSKYLGTERTSASRPLFFIPRGPNLNSFIFKCFEWKTSIGPQPKHDRRSKYSRNGLDKYVHLILFHPVYCEKCFWKWLDFGSSVWS